MAVFRENKCPKVLARMVVRLERFLPLTFFSRNLDCDENEIKRLTDQLLFTSVNKKSCNRRAGTFKIKVYFFSHDIIWSYSSSKLKLLHRSRSLETKISGKRDQKGMFFVPRS